ncbi:hypothetical protein B0H34DRAFT_792278 [Crassisporium funariophilum]|nr:hypothetical protein B0H34DRAFT_792278 [Crassisporium funariophilum]
MARRNRPTAFEVSFPGEVAAMAAAEAEKAAAPKPIHALLQSRSSSAATSSSLKRKSAGPGDPRAAKRQELPPVAYYQKHGPRPLIESSNLVIPGEDPEQEDDEEKPVRVLSDFTIFDPKHRNELVSLASIEEDDGVDRQFEGVGNVLAYFGRDEDEGQEDEMDHEPQNVHLGAILRYTLDYTQVNEPVYIETQYAWYILNEPSEQYRSHYRHFYRPRRIAQLVISTAIRRPQQNYESFLARFTSMVDMFKRSYVEDDIWASIAIIQEAIQDEEESKKISSVPFVKHILRRAPETPGRRHKPPRDGPRNKHLPKNKATTGNPDLAVLKAENQNPTHVTPRIAALAQGLVNEELVVVGPPPPTPNKALVEAERIKAHAYLRQLITISKKPKKKLDWQKKDRVASRLDLLSTVKVENDIYNIGDVVLIPNDYKALWESPGLLSSKAEIPSDARIDDYFWFAQIKYIVIENQRAHVQWFNHGSGTVTAELAHRQELFLADQCGEANLQSFAGKVTVHQRPSPDKIVKPDEYFYNFMYDAKLSAFTSIDTKRLDLSATQDPPHNCPACMLDAQREVETDVRELRDEHGHKHGVAYGATNFHLEDFVLYRADKGPADIGYITGIALSTKPPSVTVRKVGRISSLASIMPAKMLRDERHLYLTDEEEKVGITSLLKVIYVPSFQSFEPPHHTLEDWLELSYDHFYLRYTFPKLKVKSWKDRRTMTWKELLVCTPCYKDRLKGRKVMYNFLQHAERKPLPTLDLFGGVGAFSRGLAEGSGCLSVTHAIEIGPSAAKTFKRNSPHTIVYNQCANVMLRYAIKSQQGHQTEAPKQLYNGQIPVPDPPKRGDIQVITAGFPCQTHSTLNMFKNVDDVKSNLILTTLSFVDHYRPAFAFFENVPGFLNYSLNAVQAGRYRVEGGVEMGGLKLLVRALIDMGYQVRYGLLQAGHYGTPQRRVRFFLITAQDGQPLPELPQPTHEFPVVNSLQIKHVMGDYPPPNNISPIRTTSGTAAHPFVTIDAAIGDLPRFDWKNPNLERETAARRRERRARETEIPSKECRTDQPYCGFKGEIGYHQNPNTSYQQKARLVPTTDIQHYTRVLLPKKVERVVHIPLTPDADYRSLPPDKFEWQFADPSSAIARANYRPGAYGRLDKNGFFPTTVTNMDPTAKQSRVLHPYCHRMVTVRELARSQGFPDNFIFEAIGDNVVTMHRQIGNAVPLPVAHAIGRELRKTLYHKWKAGLDEAIKIDDDSDHEPEPHHLEVVMNGDDSDEEDRGSDMYTD